MTLHIFNPSHDEALGFGSPYYVPTKAAQKLATQRCTLPLLWAKPGDIVLITDDYDRTQDAVNGVGLMYKRELTPKVIASVTRIKPWGWNLYLRHTLRRMGFNDALLPSDQQIEALRMLSCRKTAVDVLKQLSFKHPLFEGDSSWCVNTEEAWTAINHYGTAMAKSPWSSSGRGVFRVEAEHNVFPAHERIANIIKQYGGIAIERYCQRLVDFAIEYEAHPDGDIQYVGISVFQTSVGGNYIGNVQGTQSELYQVLESHVKRGDLDEIITIVANELCTTINGAYCGPLGVDMMVIQTNAGVKVHPCVEINFRNTMGHVALHQNMNTAKTTED